MLTVRPPAVAGLFYPSNPAILTETVDALLSEAQTPKEYSRAIIAPHAGYVYSGAIAATAYRALDPETKRVIVLGPTHRVGIEGMALTGAQFQRTPLGDIPTDDEMTKVLEGLDAVITAPIVHAQEHSIEVHLPFLQRYLSNEFTVVPVAVGRASSDEVAAVIDAAWRLPDTAVVVSSDLSHFLPYDVAKRVDAGTLTQIVARGPALTPDQACGAYPVSGMMRFAAIKGLQAHILAAANSGDTAGDKARVVGYPAVAWYPSGGADEGEGVAVEDAQQAQVDSSELRTDKKDGDTVSPVPAEGDRDEGDGKSEGVSAVPGKTDLDMGAVNSSGSDPVTGSGSRDESKSQGRVQTSHSEPPVTVADSSVENAGAKSPTMEAAPSLPDGPSPSPLVRKAYNAIARELGAPEMPAETPDLVDKVAEDIAFAAPGATFVTLHLNEQLRGCVGSLVAHRPLGQDVEANARAAAFGDSRFPPLSAEEFAHINLEVSELTPAQPLWPEGEAPPEENLLLRLRPGIDGVIVEYGPWRATFLPQVWDQLPEPRDFLAHLKAKAGLPIDFWSPQIRVSVYQVRDHHFDLRERP